MKRTHGMSKTRFYGVWNDMMMRCYNEKRNCYLHYGGRGIRVERRWWSFDNFKTDMYSTYKKGLSLERVNVNKNYCRSNCKWIPLRDQRLNKRKSITLEYLGIKYTVPDFAEKYNLELNTLYKRINLGFDMDKCLNGDAKMITNSNGERKTIYQWHIELGISQQTIWNRLNKGFNEYVCLFSNKDFFNYQKTYNVLKNQE